MGLRLVSLAGIFVFVAIAWLLSVNRRGVSWRPVVWGLSLQLVLGAIVLTPALQDFFFTVVDGGVRRLLSFAEAGSDFVFQSVEAHRIDVVTDDGVSTLTVAGHISPPLRTVAFWILPSIIFFSSLMAILYHLRVMQPIIEFIAYVDLGVIVNAADPVISHRSAIIASYALCGFANFASIGIQLGGIGGIAPQRLPDLSRLALRAMTSGFIAACMTGAVVGLFLG